MPDATLVTYLFSDIEGSTRLWESDPAGASRAIAWHDAVSRRAVEGRRGTVVKTTGDGLYAAFDEPAAAVAAAIDLQLALAAPPDGVTAVKVRCGLHLGADQRRDNDYFGPAVNRAARIMSAAHGGQILLSKAVHDRIGDRVPESAALRDLGDVRLKDLGAPERVYQVVHRSLQAEFPPLRSLASVPNNLPQQLDRFIGREREIDEVRALLRDARLVTLSAMGGVGKSRLSIQLGAEVLDEFRDGVWRVELAPLSGAGDIAQAVAAVLGVREEPGGGVVAALERFVRERSMLLILDNCEHLVQGVAELAKRLLQAGAGLKVVATTRDPLHIAGERLFHLPTLNVPREDETHDRLLRHAAVQLFVERATAVQPAFRLTERNAPAVSEVCRRLDGIPLALELAAARVRSLPVDALAARLDQRLRLLATPDRTVLPRQRTLRALIDWSHDLLDERERAAFRRLAVFAGGWTLEAAEAVVAGDDVTPDDVLDLLASLVEKSLVAMEADSGRYRMLDTVRYYAAERLSASGDEPPVRRRHCVYYVELAERARASLWTAEQASRFRQLDTERENVLAAFDETGEASDGDSLGFRLLHALRFYLIHRGMPSAALQMSTALLGRSSMTDPLLRCRTLFGAGQAAAFMGRNADARKYLQDSLSIARALGDLARVEQTLQPLGAALMGEGSFGAARECLDEAVVLSRQSGNEREHLSALNARGMLHRLEGELDRAIEAYEAALAIARRIEDHESVAMLLLNIGMADVLRGGGSGIAQMLEEVAVIAEGTGSVAIMQSLIEVCAGRAAMNGQPDCAARLVGFAEAQAARTGLHRDAADQAFLDHCTRDLRARREEFESVQQQGARLTLEDALREARCSLCAAALGAPTGH